jgi:hypothetical protein
VIKYLKLFLVLGVPFVLLFFSNCKKDQFGNGPLAFSTDTLTFDTVFTTLGSTTQSFKVFNNSKKTIRIDNIQLAHLVGTQFRINVDGVPGDHFTGVEVPPKDSIYVFVEVTVNPNDKATPFVIIDNVNFTIGSKTQTVYLQAFGQNAHFHYGEEIKPGETKTWTNDLPHVIISRDTQVGIQIDCGGTLNINPGCQVLFTSNSAMFVYGTLNAVAHNWQDSIVFRGVRLESYYDDLPGQWFGLVFLRNNGCVPQGTFDHCVVNESSYGIYVGAGQSRDLSYYQSAAQRPVVTLHNTIVKNSQYNALYGFNAKISADNSLFYASGDNLLKLGLGGEYNFSGCTMYNTGSLALDHQKEILLLSNFVADGDGNVYPGPLKTNFSNCVIYGSLNNEISFNNSDQFSLTNFDNTFSYCLLKSPVDTVNIFSTVNNKNLFNQDPGFKNPYTGDFTPADSTGYISPIIDYCPAGLPKDLYDHSRPVSKTTNSTKYDIGAVEAQ